MENIELTQEATEQLDEIIEKIGQSLSKGYIPLIAWNRPILKGVKECLAEYCCTVQLSLLGMTLFLYECDNSSLPTLP